MRPVEETVSCEVAFLPIGGLRRRVDEVPD